MKKQKTKKLLAAVFLFFVFSSHLLSSPFFFSLPPSRNSYPGSHRRLSSPFPTTVLAFHLPPRRSGEIRGGTKTKESNPIKTNQLSPESTRYLVYTYVGVVNGLWLYLDMTCATCGRSKRRTQHGTFWGGDTLRTAVQFWDPK